MDFLRMDFLAGVPLEELLLFMALTLPLKDLLKASSSVSDGNCCRRPLVALSVSISSRSGFSVSATGREGGGGGGEGARFLSMVD